MKNYWKLSLGILFIIIAGLVILRGFLPAHLEHEAERARLQADIADLRKTIDNNLNCCNAEERLPEDTAEIAEKLNDFYSRLPKEMKEEDQIMYIIQLESLLGCRADFQFDSPTDAAVLSDGSVLQTLMFTVNYECRYENFSDLVSRLAADENITSVHCATMNYHAEKDTVSGTITLIRYLLNSQQKEYNRPDIAVPKTGKDNIFVPR